MEKHREDGRMIFDEAARKIQIGVEELCHTVVNHASIDARGFRIREDGGRIGEMLMQKHGLRYQPSVPLARTFCRGGLFYEISGVCDGVLRLPDRTVVFVNRCAGGNTEALSDEQTAEFVGQAVVFAAMAAEIDMLGKISFCVTLYHSKQDVRTIEKTYTRREMTEALYRLIDLHRPFAALAAERMCVRLPGAKLVQFPYQKIRPQQRDFMIEVLRAVKSGGKVLIEAPTGTGKTVAALYPAIKALGGGLVDKIFYFTAKTTTALAALEAAKKLSEKTGIRAVHITAKERNCPVKLRDPFKCTPGVCPRANGHYKRLPEAIADIVTAYRVIDSAAIEDCASQHSVCPYEFALDLSDWCDLVICDYNYLIDETACLRRYFSTEAPEGGRYLFLFDEAHNLLDRAKACYGAELRLSEIRSFLDGARMAERSPVCQALTDVEFYVNSMRELCQDETETDENGLSHGFCALRAFDKKFYDLLVALEKETEKYIRSPAYGVLPESLHELRAHVKKYIGALELFDDCFAHTVQVNGGEVITKIVCLDPSAQLEKKMARGRASVLFSATLTPLDYYAALCGAKESARLKLDCPYDASNLCVCIMDKLSVKYQYRSQNAAAVADAIMSTVGRRDGNYMVYFPSYEYMSEVQTLFKYKYPHIRTVVQAKGMSETARRGFLDTFRAGARTTLVGFSVLGGIYSEGIDLAGDRLIGTVIVGVGLLQPSNEGELVREYYDNKYELGREYAYIYPGFNRVLQAAGRVIRTETDRGVIVLIDERYAEEPYHSLLPAQFRRAKFVGDVRALAAVVGDFWEAQIGVQINPGENSQK